MTRKTFAKRKRTYGVVRKFLTETNCVQHSVTLMSPTAKPSESPVPIGHDSPEIGARHDTEVCSIRDSEEPKRRQSSLLTFFSKSKRRPKPLPGFSTNTDNDAASGSDRQDESELNIISTTEETTQKRLETGLSYKQKKTPKRNIQSKRSISLTQVYIDCGQSKFGQIVCDKCGMLYVPGVQEDELQHKQLCQAHTLGIPCPRGNIKGGRELGIPHKSGAKVDKIVLWKPRIYHHRTKSIAKTEVPRSSDEHVGNDKDLPSQWPMLARMISKDLGTLEETTLRHLSQHSVVLYIGTTPETDSSSVIHKRIGRILGVATVQILGKQVSAFEMISLTERSATPIAETKLGIGLLWTHPIARNKGIATQLVDAARVHAVFGMNVSNRADMAFSSPTQAGFWFARSYSGHGRRANQAASKEPVQLLPEATTRRGPLVYEMDL